MIKPIGITAFVFIGMVSLAVVYKPNYRTDIAQERMKGRVKAYTEACYTLSTKQGVEARAFKYKQRREFGAQGNCIKRFDYTLEDSVKYISGFNHDKNGMLVKQEFFKTDDMLGYWLVFNYDAKQNLVEIQTHLPGDSLFIRTYNEYDEKGNCIKSKTTGKNGSLTLIQTFVCDEHGDKIESTDMRPDGTLDSKSFYEYKYDKTGNWIQRTTYTDNEPKEVTDRFIDYY